MSSASPGTHATTRAGVRGTRTRHTRVAARICSAPCPSTARSSTYGPGRLGLLCALRPFLPCSLTVVSVVYPTPYRHHGRFSDIRLLVDLQSCTVMGGNGEKNEDKVKSFTYYADCPYEFTTDCAVGSYHVVGAGVDDIDVCHATLPVSPVFTIGKYVSPSHSEEVDWKPS